MDLVRVSCPDRESALALREIVPEVGVPVIADIHFHYKRAIEAAQSGAACLRINPGNIGSPERVREVVQAAKDHDCWRNTASRTRRRWSRARWSTPRSCRTTTSTSSRSA